MVKDKVRKAFEKYNIFNKAIKVEFAYLFGSVSKKSAGPLSDIDIAVYLSQPSLEQVLGRHLFLSRELKTDRIDLLVLNTAENIILIDKIVREGIVVHEKTPSLRESFELSILHRKLILGR